MLRKLYAHEFYALYKRLFPVYIGLALITVMTRASYLINTEDYDFLFGGIIKGSATVLSVLAIIAMAVISMVIILMRFYKNLLGNEGYLTFTLPVTPLNHIWCKLITAFIATVTTAIVAFGAIIALLAGTDIFTTLFTEFKDILIGLYNLGAVKFIVISSQTVILAITIIFSALLMFYVSMAFGQQFKKRIAGAIITYIVIYTIMQMLETTVLVVAVALSEPITQMINDEPFLSLTLGLSLAILYNLALSAVYFIVTHHMLTKKLNLE
ncbi:MAG: hypothetical protein MJ091_05665 [Clostridia bacterium]|nr:hypothetical protein [Clostridia bacterium]